MPTFGAGGLLPFTGNYFFVNETTGSDGNTGGAQDPLATLTRALALCTSGNNDVVFVTGTIHVTATVAWNKNNTHLVGLAGPIQTNQRARISQTGSTLFTPLVNVTGRGCIFTNLGAFHGFADTSAQICWVEGGGNNYYSSVSFLGMENATGAAAQAGSRSLTVGTNTTGENTFINCTVGSDTITRSAANYSLEFLSGTPRNTFRNCIFSCLTSSATAAFINAAASSIDRFQVFDNCYFLNQVKSTSTTLNQAFNISSSCGGEFFLTNCGVYGVTAQETSASGNIIGNNPAPAAATSGKSIATIW